MSFALEFQTLRSFFRECGPFKIFVAGFTLEKQDGVGAFRRSSAVAVWV